jgi:glycosyltransferase involved in cell wall biosynthesis
MALTGGSMKLKVVFKAPILTRSGYGEQSRFAMRALKSRPDLFDLNILPIQWGTTSWINEETDERKWIDKSIQKAAAHIQQGGKFDVSMQVTIPNEFEKMAPINLGYTAGIETTKVAHEWIQKVNEMQGVVVVSNHAKNVFENTVYNGEDESTGQKITLKTTTPIGAANYPVKIYKTEELPQVELKLEHETNFLTIAQLGPRKNMPNTIKWFVEEFANDEIGLIVKTNLSKNCVMDRQRTFYSIKNLLDQYPDRKCKVYLLHGDMTDEEIHSLYLHPKVKAYVGLPHGEGFGLPFFEAAYSGLPVIAPGWSGQLDFLVDEQGKEHFYNVSFDLLPVQDEVVWDGVLIKDSMWAYPRETSAKNKMRECYNDITSGADSTTAEYAIKLKERFSEEKMYAQFVDFVVGYVRNTGLVGDDWGLAPQDIDADYIFVSDIFKHQYVGGAELSLDALITSCPGTNYSINSQSLTKAFIEQKRDSTWIFGNIANIEPEILSHILDNDLKYYFIEFDYKFCEYRNPALYEKLEEKECDYNSTELATQIKNFVNSSSKTFFMSEGQMNTYKECLSDLDDSKMEVLSSIFDDQFFELIDEIREENPEKEDKWIVLGSRSWVKGSSESEEWCKKNNLNYEVISNLPYPQVLKKLAVSKGICFKPTALDTCPRFVIEAKTLGCELELNDNVQHLKENWFNNSSVEEMLDYLKTRRETFWNAVAPAVHEQNANAK